MRLDKFLSITGTASRSETKRAVRNGDVTVNGVQVKSSETQINPEADTVTVGGKTVIYRKNTYIMLNKPEGYVSATDDKKSKTVLELLPDDVRTRNLFPCGRLDKNTLGLMLITDNGDLAHRLLAPKSHVTKKYRFQSSLPISTLDAARFEDGLILEDGYVTKPARIELDKDGKSGIITLTEGKYHQIKRMLEALGNKITYLERITFGSLTLDPALERGEWRYLCEEEISALEKEAMKK